MIKRIALAIVAALTLTGCTPQDVIACMSNWYSGVMAWPMVCGQVQQAAPWLFQ